MGCKVRVNGWEGMDSTDRQQTDGRTDGRTDRRMGGDINAWMEK